MPKKGDRVGSVAECIMTANSVTEVIDQLSAHAFSNDPSRPI